MMVLTRHAAIAIFALFCTACTHSNVSNADGDQISARAYSFVVIGDTPYSDADYPMLESAVADIKSRDIPFVIHVGDYKGGGAPCTSDHDAFHQSLIESLHPIPVFYTPGDNEYTDCDRFLDDTTGLQVSDLDRLDTIRALFFSEPVPVPKHFSYQHHGTLTELASWVFGDIQFMTLHVTGTNNGRDWVTGDPLERAQTSIEKRDNANREWLAQSFGAARSANSRAVVIAMQADIIDIADKPEDIMCTDVSMSDDHPCDAFANLRAQIRNLSMNFDGPVLIIHGDTPPFTLNQQFAGEEAPNLWRLNAAGDAGIGQTGFPYGKRDVTLVTIDPDAEEIFSARGLLTGDPATAK